MRAFYHDVEVWSVLTVCILCDIEYQETLEREWDSEDLSTFTVSPRRKKTPVKKRVVTT